MSTTYLTNPVDISSKISGTGWQEIDISAEVPVGTDFVFLYMGGGQSESFQVRRTDSTDDRSLNRYFVSVATNVVSTCFVGLDANRKFDYYSNVASGNKLWIVAYSDGDFVTQANATDITPSANGSWEDKDLTSSYSEGTYNAVLVEIENLTTTKKFDIRMKGDTKDYYADSNQGLHSFKHRFMVVGMDANGVIQMKKEDANVKFWLHGAITIASGFTPVKRSDKSFSLTQTLSTFEDNTLDTDKMVFTFGTGATSGQIVTLREKGSSYDPSGGDSRVAYGFGTTPEMVLVKGDASDVIQTYLTSGSAVDPFHYVGVMGAYSVGGEDNPNSLFFSNNF